MIISGIECGHEPECGVDVDVVDDDRWDFIRSIHYCYFWSLAESLDLVNDVSQNCEAFGVTMDEVKKTASVSAWNNGPKSEKYRKCF